MRESRNIVLAVVGVAVAVAAVWAVDRLSGTDSGTGRRDRPDSAEVERNFQERVRRGDGLERGLLADVDQDYDAIGPGTAQGMTCSTATENDLSRWICDATIAGVNPGGDITFTGTEKYEVEFTFTGECWHAELVKSSVSVGEQTGRAEGSSVEPRNYSGCL